MSLDAREVEVNEQIEERVAEAKEEAEHWKKYHEEEAARANTRAPHSHRYA